MTVPPAIVGALLGAVLALGVGLVVVGAPWMRRVDLAQRIAPYLDGPAAGTTGASTAPTWHPGTLVRLGVRRAGWLLDRLLGGAASVRVRLQRAGLPPDVEGFRVQQVLWGVSSGVFAAGLGSLLWWTRGAGPAAVVVVVGAAALTGVVLRDYQLTRAATRRERRMLAEFPAVAELLALAVTAGEGIGAALDRVARLSDGDLPAELEMSLAQTRTGTPLAEALLGMSERVGLAPVTRFVDAVVIAAQRGTSLGEVLRAQAQDAREAARQVLVEEGGKREIAMMVPVVFLVLPVTVLFAVFPGASLLRIGV